MFKVICIFTFVLSLAFAEQPYCQPCKTGFTKLGEFLILEESLERQIDVLSAFVCDEGVDGCYDGIKLWWPLMARALFSYDGTIPALCGDIGVCEPLRYSKRFFKQDPEITCEMCLIAIDQLSTVFQSEKNVLRTIDLLIGEAFCTEPSSGYGQECIDFVQDFTPKAMPVMAELFLDEKPIFCGSEVLGLCD